MKQRAYKFIICCIHIYQRIAPSWIRNSCRYTPTCSQYAIIVINEQGSIKGLILSLLRILRCIPPFGGIDWPNKHQKGDCSDSDKLSRV
ncbi:MAG: membrane protein insertion efficiency factor YidD [Planctomycetota bacterium]